MSLPTWKCEVCEKTFKVGDWICQDGQVNHKVAYKLYLLADAPSDPGHLALGSNINPALREGRTRICNIPPDKTVLRNGEAVTVPGSYVEFIQGRFSSNDPEIQYCLDKKGGFCSQEQWDAAWLTDNQRLTKQRLELDAMAQRLENDRNELLAQQKQQRVGARA
jgi:hypothetical protein